MLGYIAIACGMMLAVASPAIACDLCTALSSDKTAFEDYWFPAIGKDPSLGFNWKELSLNDTQQQELSKIESEWKEYAAARLDAPNQSPETKLQDLLKDPKNKTREIMNTFKEIGQVATKSRENFEQRYKLLTREQQERLQELYRKREVHQARLRVMRDIARQDMDAGMVLGSKARKRVLCPYAQLDRTSVQKSSYMIL